MRVVTHVSFPKATRSKKTKARNGEQTILETSLVDAKSSVHDPSIMFHFSAIRVLANNCVSEIKVPKDVESAHTVDYNPVLGLYATVNRERGSVSVWNPVTEGVVASFSTTCDGFSGAIFLPGDRVGVSASTTHHGGDVEIHTLDGKKSKLLKIEEDQLRTTYPGPIALNPREELYCLQMLKITVGRLLRSSWTGTT